MIQKLRQSIAGLFYGWRMVALGCAIRMLGGGFHLYGFTIFFLPITQELGLSRAATSLVFSLARAEGAIEGPVAGYLIDRFGPRPMMLAGVLLSGVGYMLLATVSSYYGLLSVYLGVISLSFSAGFMHSPHGSCQYLVHPAQSPRDDTDQQRHWHRRNDHHAGVSF
jgi:MFS family permease